MEDFLAIILWILVIILLFILSDILFKPSRSSSRLLGMGCFIISIYTVSTIVSYKSNIILLTSILICISIFIIIYLKRKKQ
jgi:hypothetical protein